MPATSKAPATRCGRTREPHQPAADQARLGRESQPPALPGLPAQRTTPREVFALKGEQGRQLLDRWLSWARRCRIPAFVHLAQRLTKHREAIDATLDHRLSNGLVESTNTKIRLLTRIAFGFKSPEAMIALAMLNLGGYCPPLPGRQAA